MGRTYLFIDYKSEMLGLRQSLPLVRHSAVSVIKWKQEQDRKEKEDPEKSKKGTDNISFMRSNDFQNEIIKCEECGIGVKVVLNNNRWRN